MSNAEAPISMLHHRKWKQNEGDRHLVGGHGLMISERVMNSY